jgi:glycosyltransferase involved in cell wall biosynthesis
MRLIYDISVLGQGCYLSSSRTGVFRAIENLAQELVKAKAVSSFSSTLSVSSYFKSLDYLQSNSLLGSISLTKPDMPQDSLKMYQFITAHTRTKESTPFYKKEISRLTDWVARKTLQHKTINRFDLVSTEIYHSPFYPFPEQIKRYNKLKKVITIYDLIPILYPKFFQNKKNGPIHSVLRSIDENTWVTCISQATKNDLCNYLPSLDPARVFVTHLAASELFYQCQDLITIEETKSQFGIPEGPYVLSLSTLEPRKNISQTIRCFTRILIEGSIKDLVLVLVGTKGWDFEDIFNEIAASTELRKRIIVTGYVPDEYLSPLYSGAMMFIYPSFYEGFGLPPLEAMQCGVPVITSNTSSLPEVVGDAGIMIDPNDDDALCHAMLRVYSSAKIRRDMTVNSLAQAEKFSWKKCAAQTIDVYKAALAE